MFNLNFSGLFGGGAFAIDPTKFNFSAYTPEPKKEVVTDPVAVVSDNSPTPDVEVLEGAGTVAVTQPDPVQQAINELQGKDLSDGFNANPMNTTPVTPTADPIEQATQSVQPAAMPSLSNLGGISGVDVTQSSVDKLFSDAEIQQQILNPLISDIDNFGLDNFSVKANDGFITKDQFGEIKDLMGSDEFASILDKYNSGMKDAFGDTYDGSFQGYDDKRSVLDSLGITNSFKVYTDELGSFDFMEYNSETGQFEKQEDLSKEVSMANQVVKGVAESLPIMVATAGLGSALGAVTGATTATGNAIAQGIASATVTKITGGDTGDVLQSAVMGGLSGYTKGLQVDINNAQEGLTQLQNVANSSVLGESLIAGTQVANAAETVQALQSQMSLVNNIKYGINLVEAADSKDILGVINAGMQLSGNDTLKTAVQGVLTDNFDSDLVARHGDAMSEAILKTTDKLIKGESLDSALISGMVQYGRSGGGLGLEMPEGDGSFDLGIALETPEWVDEFVKVVQGGIKWVDTNVTRPTVKTIKGIIGETGNVADAAIRALPTEIEDWERLGDTIVKGGESVVEGVDEIVREIPTTKEDWEGAVDTVKSAANTVEETYQEYIEEPIEEAAGAVREFIDEVLPSSPDAPRLDVGDIPTVDLEGLDLALDLGFGSRPQKELEDSDIIKYKRSNPITYDTSIEDLTNLLLKS